MTAPRQRVVVSFAVVLAVSMGAGLALQRAGLGAFYVALVCGQSLLYGAAMLLLLKYGLGRRALVLCLACAALMRVVVVAAPPMMSTDVYRYVWDGRVQAAGINPYRYIPSDPALASLRDDAIYPNINRKSYAPTIYPPGAQAIFFLVTRLSESVVAMKLAMVGFEIVAVLLLRRMLRRAGLPPERVLLYALHPLPAWEFAGSGHVDAAVIALTVLALFLHQRGGRWSTGIALALAAVVKPFPLAIAPALWRRWDWRLPAAFTVTVALAYALYLDVGARVLGFLPTYVQEEGLASGTAFYPLWLLRAALPVAIPTVVYLTVAALALVGFALVLVHRNDDAAGAGAAWRNALLLAAAFMFASSPHFPWYLVWLLPLCCLAPWLPALYLVSSSVLLYLPVEFGLVGSIAYGGFAILALADRLLPSALLIQEKRDVVGCAR
jgi:alpha-1,6-mannosyltransferase